MPEKTRLSLTDFIKNVVIRQAPGNHDKMIKNVAGKNENIQKKHLLCFMKAARFIFGEKSGEFDWILNIFYATSESYMRNVCVLNS